MTEDELLRHICAMAHAESHGGQPPFADVAVPLHPDSPIDYEAVREKAFTEVLGEPDFVYHSFVGAPHVDIYRYPHTEERSFWCYATNGMSDFPQVLPDGTSFRSEITCCCRSPSPAWAELLRVLGTFPFRARTFLHVYHTVPFPDGIGERRFTYVMTIPPFLSPKLHGLSFLGHPLLSMGVIRITEDDRDLAIQNSSQYLVDRLPDELDTWLIDGNRRD